ncbi:single-stranded DNA-binding protein [Streptomyces sp. SPB074]|uniref:single-stranded DNA-binding protein n=1 Tax=Streptomyces sp. (strain SPB074) TaxID=465543 RepID=UPI001F1B9870|nr:single-stranded DNA-binding protein [Streptomyces sp. SPB074]
MVTVVGNVATDPAFRETRGGAMARFRLAATARRWDRGEGRWIDGHTNFFTVLAWRHLADNVSSSVAIGDPVVVHGRLRMREEEYDGQRRVSAEIDAISVGHDLTRGTSAFRRPPRDDGRSGAAATVVARERRYGAAPWGPAANAPGGSGATDRGGTATREPARVGDVVDELFLRSGPDSGAEGREEAVAPSAGTGWEASGPVTAAPVPEPGSAVPEPSFDAVASSSSATPAPTPADPDRVLPFSQANPVSVPADSAPDVAEKRPLPWIVTPPAPDDEPGVKTASRRRSAAPARAASSVPSTPSAEAAPSAGTESSASGKSAAPVASARARRAVTKRRAPGVEGKPAPGMEPGAEKRAGAEAVAGVREPVSVGGGSLGDPDAVPPF